MPYPNLTLLSINFLYEKNFHFHYLIDLTFGYIGKFPTIFWDFALHKIFLAIKVASTSHLSLMRYVKNEISLKQLWVTIKQFLCNQPPFIILFIKFLKKYCILNNLHPQTSVTWFTYWNMFHTILLQKVQVFLKINNA